VCDTSAQSGISAHKIIGGTSFGKFDKTARADDLIKLAIEIVRRNDPKELAEMKATAESLDGDDGGGSVNRNYFRALTGAAAELAGSESSWPYVPGNCGCDTAKS
jgi:hypothetical protein